MYLFLSLLEQLASSNPTNNRSTNGSLLNISSDSSQGSILCILQLEDTSVATPSETSDVGSSSPRSSDNYNITSVDDGGRKHYKNEKYRSENAETGENVKNSSKYFLDGDDCAVEIRIVFVSDM